MTTTTSADEDSLPSSEQSSPTSEALELRLNPNDSVENLTSLISQSNAQLIERQLKLFPSRSSPQNTLIIWDWDDTFLPTYFLSTDMNHQSLEKISPEIVPILKQLEQRALMTLKMSMQRSSAMFVTNASYRWFADSASRYLPKLWDFLVEKKVKIISARDVCQQLNIVQSEWKRLLIRDQVEMFFKHLYVNPDDIDTVDCLLRSSYRETLFPKLIHQSSLGSKSPEDSTNIMKYSNKYMNSPPPRLRPTHIPSMSHSEDDSQIRLENIDPSIFKFYADERISQAKKIDRFCRTLCSVLPIDSRVLTMTGLFLKSDQDQTDNATIQSCTNSGNRHKIEDPPHLEPCPDTTSTNPVSTNLATNPCFNHDPFKPQPKANGRNNIYKSLAQSPQKKSLEPELQATDILPIPSSFLDCNNSNVELNEFHVMLLDQYYKVVTSRLGKRSSQEIISRHQFSESQSTQDSFDGCFMTMPQLTNTQLDSSFSQQSMADNVTSILCVSDDRSLSAKHTLVIPPVANSKTRILGGLMSINEPYAVSANGDVVLIHDMFPNPPSELGLKKIPCSVISIGDGESEREATLAAMAHLDLHYRLVLQKLSSLRQYIFEELFLPFLDYCLALTRSFKLEGIETSPKQHVNSIPEAPVLQAPSISWSFKSVKLKTHPTIQQLSRTHSILIATLPMLMEIDCSVDAVLSQNLLNK